MNNMSTVTLLWVVVLYCLLPLTAAQSSINSYEGFNIGKNAGIVIGCYFLTLAFVTITINLLKMKVVDRAGRMPAAST